jgi:hypothetical protein
VQGRINRKVRLHGRIQGDARKCGSSWSILGIGFVRVSTDVVLGRWDERGIKNGAARRIVAIDSK